MIRGIAIIIVSFIMVFNTLALPKQDYIKELKNYIGTTYTELPKEIKDLQENKQIDIFYGEKKVINSICIKDNKLNIDGIKIGDELGSIEGIYPEEWVNPYDEGIIILLEKAIHYDIATKYIDFVSKDGKTISEIRIGYTADFVKEPLPDSQKTANEMLQGKWVSNQKKEMTFLGGKLSDSVFDKLYEYQEYKVISPNELIIYRKSSKSLDRVKIKFWITEESLYLFLIDELGVPIKSTIEQFTKNK